jgi:hypothetical protein
MLRIGKKIFSWNSVGCRMAGLKTEKLTSIDFDEKVTAELVYGSRPDGTPLDSTSGKFEPGTVTIKMLLDGWHGNGLLVPGFEKLIALGGAVGLTDTEWDLDLQFFEPLVGVVDIYFPALRVMGRKGGHAIATSGSEVEISCMNLQPIRANGVQLASVIRSFTGV